MINKPLAYRMRPDNLDQVIGQNKIKDFLNNLISNSSLVSIIFYGPPGTGKTTLAKAFSKSFNANCLSLNAVIDKKEKMEATFEEAIRFYPTIVIIDEIHRLDKAKQDLLLPHLENGDFYLIGCTTANPLISIRPAIRSRCRLLATEELSKDEVKSGLLRAISSEKGLNNSRKFSDDAIDYLASISAGDLRFAYNQLEAITLSFTKDHLITLQDAKDIANVPNYYADLNEDEHYDTVSALQKSIRGSQVDAAIYYAAKLLKSGDLDGLVRRLLVTAYEDVGLANPQAVDRCYNACQVAKEVGLPEAMIPIGFTIVDLALSPKSKSSCTAIEEASAMIDNKPIRVRSYLRLKQADSPVKYPYDRPDVWPKLQYMPEGLEDYHFYNPTLTGKYERALAQQLEKLNQIERTTDIEKAKRLKSKL